MVPSEFADFCRRWQFLRPCETTIKNVASDVGEMAEILQETYDETIHHDKPALPEGTRLVVFSRDGTMSREYRMKLELSLNGVDQLIASIKYCRDKLGAKSMKRRQAVGEALRYFRPNRVRVHYALCRIAGLPIGSGVMEAGCKAVVGNRLKRAGMRWSRDGGQQILNLRTLVSSQR